MRKILFLFLVALGQASFAQTSRPNIILILADDLRDELLPEQGNNFLQATNIQRLRNEGIRFNNSFGVISLCAPGRASIFTGMYPQQHGIYSNDTVWHLSPTIPMIHQALQDSGYYTGFVGKVHVLGNFYPGNNYLAQLKLAAPYTAPGFIIGGTTYYYPNYVADVIDSLSLSFIRMRDTSKPFYLVMSHKNVHDPYTASPEFEHLLDTATIFFPPTFNEDISDKPTYLQPFVLGWSLAKWDSVIKNYYEGALSLDKSVGKLMDSLQAWNLLDNTMIIFTSDNGMMIGDHDRQMVKHEPYDWSLRVPLFVRYPAWFSSGSSYSLNSVLNIDLAPTILEAAGVPVLPGMNGISLHQFTSGGATREKFLFEQYIEPGLNYPTYYGVRTNTMKFVRYTCGADTNEFYDLVLDSLEENNQINNLAYASSIALMDRMLDTLLFSIQDSMAICDTTIYHPLHTGNISWNQEFSFYPNPASDFVLVYPFGTGGKLQLTVCDLLGKPVIQKVLERKLIPESALVDISQLPAGSYFISLQSGDKISTKLLIKTRELIE